MKQRFFGWHSRQSVRYALAKKKRKRTRKGKPFVVTVSNRQLDSAGRASSGEIREQHSSKLFPQRSPAP
jgi:hypothetical protein